MRAIVETDATTPPTPFVVNFDVVGGHGGRGDD